MAQDLEKSVIGKSAVINSPDGTKKVDYARLMGASLAALSSHHKDIKKINKSLEYLKQIVERESRVKK